MALELRGQFGGIAAHGTNEAGIATAEEAKADHI
jgi:hypothetical protein